MNSIFNVACNALLRKLCPLLHGNEPITTSYAQDYVLTLQLLMRTHERASPLAYADLYNMSLLTGEISHDVRAVDLKRRRVIRAVKIEDLIRNAKCNLIRKTQLLLFLKFN